jgi:hypothetical protein
MVKNKNNGESAPVHAVEALLVKGLQSTFLYLSTRWM